MDIETIIKKKEYKEKALEEWEEIGEEQKKYVLYLLKTGKKYSNPNHSALLFSLGISEEEPKESVYRKGRSLCDVDSDFCKRNRGKVIEYVIEKYGKDKVSQIGTYSVFKPRGSLRNFARILGYPKEVGESLAAMIPPDDAGKTLTFKEVIEMNPKILKTGYSDVVDAARKAEGLISQAGVHAAGVVIASEEIRSVVPLFRGKSEEIATQFDMNDVENIGLVKYDFLGLKTLTVVNDTLQLVKKNKGIEIDINAIDLEDPKVYKEIFQKGALSGVFQFETSSGFKKVCMQVKPKDINDLSAITSIYRPGPIRSGLVDKYVECRNGADPVYDIPELEPVLKSTYSVMCFQEQIMKICVDLAGYTLVEAENMRKIIGKKLREKMVQERTKFVGGCIKNGIEEDKAEKLFDDIEEFSKYSFNKCLVGETKIKAQDKDLTINEIKTLLDSNEKVILKSFDTEKDEIFDDECVEVIDCGKQAIYELKLSTGDYIRCTLNHKFLCRFSLFEETVIKYYTVKEIVEGNSDLFLPQRNEFVKILSYKKIGIQKTFNLTMKSDFHNYILSSGIVSANSHAVAYSILSAQTAWLKTYYPQEFYCSLFNSSLMDADKQEDLIKYFYSCQEEGISVSPPNVNLSQETFIVENGTIIFSLAGIKGLGEKACKTIIGCRPEEGFKSIQHMVERGVPKGAIKALISAGATEEIEETNQQVLLYNLDNLLSYYEKTIRWEERNKEIEERQLEIQAAITRGEKPPRKRPKNRAKPEKPELLSPKEGEEVLSRIELERKTLGVYLTGHPILSYLRPNSQRITLLNIKEGEVAEGQRITVPVVITSIEERTTKKKQLMASLVLDDKTARIEAVVFPKQWAVLKEDAREDVVSLVSGKVELTYIEENRDGPPIVNFLIDDIRTVKKEERINDVVLKTREGFIFTFHPGQEVRYSSYENAKALIENFNSTNK